MLYQKILYAFKDLGNSTMFFVLICLMILDVFIGKARAYKNSEYNSYAGVKGLINHLVVFLVSTLVGVIARVLEYDNLGSIFVSFFILDFLNSIYANAKLLGVPLPDIKLIEKEIEVKEERRNK